MSGNGKGLAKKDIEALLREPSAEQRALLAEKLAVTFAEGELSATEKTLAESIMRKIAGDAEAVVRRALAESIKQCRGIPRDLALTMANDVADVATPIIEFSAVLRDQDLIRIVQKKPTLYQKAVARRSNVSEEVSAALVATENEEVVAALVGNDGAEISETTLHRVVDKFGASEAVGEPLVRRVSLPLAITERLVGVVSDSLRDHLVTHHELPPDVAADLLMQTRERATAGLVKSDTDIADLTELVDQLYTNNRLTPTLVLRALCMGDTGFFEAAMARMADISLVNAYRLIHDQGRGGLENLYRKCGLPDGMYPVFRAAVDVSDETDYDGGEKDQERYRKRIIERLVTQFADDFEARDLDFFIAKLGKSAPGHVTAAG